MRLHLLVLSALCAANLSCKTNHLVQDRITVMAPAAPARLEQALAAVKKASLNDVIVASLEKSGGVLASDSAEKLGLLPEKIQVVDLFDADMSALMWGNDEAAVAKALAAKKVDFVLLRRDVVPSVDRGRAVASRLYHDDYRELFALVAADDEFLLYAVRAEPTTFPPQVARLVTSSVRSMLKGERPSIPALPGVKGKKWNMLMTVRRPGGRELAFGMCMRDEFRDCVIELATDMEREHRRYAEWYGLPRIKDDADNLILEVHLVTERAQILAFDEDSLNEFWEMGIDGALIYDPKVNEVAIYPGAVSYTRSYRDADTFLRRAARDGHLDSNRPWLEPEVRLEKVRTHHFMDWPGVGFLPLFRGVPPVPLAIVDLEAAGDSVVHAGEWYMTNLAPNTIPINYQPGQVTYKAWPSENRYSDEYNIVRHTLATWNLVQAWHVDPRPEFLEGARRALNYTLSFRVDEGDRTFFRHEDNVKLGTVVVGLMGMIDLARATGSHEWDDLMVRMGNFTLSMQEESGKFDPYYVPEDHPYADEKNDIVPGEAALALVMLYEYTGDKKWLEPFPKFMAYYKPWWEERVAKRREGAQWPAQTYEDLTRLDLVQLGPWTVMAVNAYHRATGDDTSAQFGLDVARWMIETYQWTSENAPWPDYIGGYYKLPGELPAMQAFCYAEGTAAAYQLALRYAPDQAPYFERATRETVRFGLQMQFDKLQVYPFTRGEEVYGGVRYAMNETKVRIDYVHHALSAIYQWREGAMSDPALPPEVKRSPARDAIEKARQEAAAKAEAEANGTAPEPSPTPQRVPPGSLPIGPMGPGPAPRQP